MGRGPEGRSLLLIIERGRGMGRSLLFGGAFDV